MLKPPEDLPPRSDIPTIHRDPAGSGRIVSREQYKEIVEHLRDTWDSDVAHCEKTVAELRNPPFEREGFGPCGQRLVAAPGEGASCLYPDCDCHDSEIIMLSSGYADACIDGSIIQHGIVVYKVQG